MTLFTAVGCLVHHVDMEWNMTSLENPMFFIYVKHGNIKSLKICKCRKEKNKRQIPLVLRDQRYC